MEASVPGKNNMILWTIQSEEVYRINVRKKPDLRRERWGNGFKGDRFSCMEIDIPDEKVVLTDFDAWSIILLNGLLSENEDEDRRKYNGACWHISRRLYVI